MNRNSLILRITQPFKLQSRNNLFRRNWVNFSLLERHQLKDVFKTGFKNIFTPAGINSVYIVEIRSIKNNTD